MPKAKQTNSYEIFETVTGTIKDAATLPMDVARAVKDELRDLVGKATTPLRTEFRPKDLLQVIIGASILAVPVGFTEETWELGGELPVSHIITLSAVSMVFIGSFVYYNYYRGTFTEHWGEYVKRVLSTYVFSLGVVAGLLSIIEVAPWSMDLALAVKRTIIVAFPASMSAVVADTIK